MGTTAELSLEHTRLLCAFAARHQRWKHAAACRSTCFWGLLVGFFKHAAACCSTLKIGLRFIGEKYRAKIARPFPERSVVRDGQCSSDYMVHL